MPADDWLLPLYTTLSSCWLPAADGQQDPDGGADDGAASSAASNGILTVTGTNQTSGSNGSIVLDAAQELYGYDVVMPDAEVPSNTTNYQCVKVSQGRCSSWPPLFHLLAPAAFCPHKSKLPGRVCRLRHSS